MWRFRGCQPSWYLLIKNSLQIHLRKDVADPTVNTCCELKVVFGKASFSFRADSSLKSDGGLYQTESFLTACISLVHEPDKPWSRQKPSCTNTRKELRRCVRRFLCPIRNRHLLEFLEMVRWESVTTGSFALTWKLSSRRFSRPDWLPLGLRECPLVDLSGLLRAHFFPTIINILEIAVCRKGL